MKILHISAYCHAGSVGGTERYLLDLIRGLKGNGFESRVGWLCGDGRNLFEAEGVFIHPLPAPVMRVDEPPATLAPLAASLLKDYCPDAVHFHTFGLAENAIARIARARGVPYLFTYHSPSWTCRREDLLIWGGRQPCDGEVRTLRCTACKVQERMGGPAVAGFLGAAASAPLDWLFRRSTRINLRRRMCVLSDTRRYRDALREFLQNCALAVSCSDWGQPILVANGADPARVRVVPQGVPHDFIEAAKTKGATAGAQNEKGTFTIGYVGRVTPVKGVDVLAEGFSRLPGEDLRLIVYGFAADEKSLPDYNEKLKALARQDRRIELRPRLALAQMAEAYSGLDLVAIPSVGLETGPLVLFEALHMGKPVFGSNRLGHLAILRQGGQVVEPNTPAAWQKALAGALEKFRQNRWGDHCSRIHSTLKLPSMSDVALNMAAYYRGAKADNSPAR